MKTALVLLLALSSFGFAKAPPEPKPHASPSSTPTHVEVTIDPIPASSPEPTRLIEIEQIQGATDAEVDMIEQGLKLANDMLSKPCFKQWVLAAKYTETNGLTQQQIYNLTQTTPMRINVEMYTGTWKANHVSKTVGYENDPYDGWVHMNRHFVTTPYLVADNILHEDRGHGLGFHHYGSHYTSQPYGMNLAYEGCSQQQMQARGGKAYKPPGIKLEIRKAKKKARK